MTDKTTTATDASAAVDTLKEVVHSLYAIRAGIHPDVLADLDAALNTIRFASNKYLPK